MGGTLREGSFRASRIRPVSREESFKRTQTLDLSPETIRHREEQREPEPTEETLAGRNSKMEQEAREVTHKRKQQEASEASRLKILEEQIAEQREELERVEKMREEQSRGLAATEDENKRSSIALTRTTERATARLKMAQLRTQEEQIAKQREELERIEKMREEQSTRLAALEDEKKRSAAALTRPAEKSASPVGAQHIDQQRMERLAAGNAYGNAAQKKRGVAVLKDQRQTNTACNEARAHSYQGHDLPRTRMASHHEFGESSLHSSPFSRGHAPYGSPEAQRFVPLQSATDVSWMQRQAQTREPSERAISAQKNPGASRSLHFDLPPDEAHACSAIMMHHVLVQNARPKSASRSLSTPAARSRPVSRSRPTSSESRPASRNKGDRPWSATPALQGLKPQPLKLLSAAELARMRASIEKSAINEIRSLEEKESAMALVAQQRSELLRRGGHEAVGQRHERQQRRETRECIRADKIRIHHERQRLLMNARERALFKLIDTARRPILRSHLNSPWIQSTPMTTRQKMSDAALRSPKRNSSSPVPAGTPSRKAWSDLPTMLEGLA